MASPESHPTIFCPIMHGVVGGHYQCKGPLKSKREIKATRKERETWNKRSLKRKRNSSPISFLLLLLSQLKGFLASLCYFKVLLLLWLLRERTHKRTPSIHKKILHESSCPFCAVIIQPRRQELNGMPQTVYKKPTLKFPSKQI